MTNKLRIRAKSLNLDLAGEPEYILRAYDAIHPVLVERFEESVDFVLDDTHEQPPAQIASGNTLRMHTAVTPEEVESAEAQGQHVRLVVCNEVYNKLHLVERAELEESVFNKAIEMGSVGRIYVNRSQSARFGEFFKFGRVLWRELTAAGKAAVKRS